ncbi:DGQHR domain-containing protein [Bacillus sp. FJAT-29790]|uniref:DNA sulfur modification protein DndB n=1 Tax=Bacillus sp. FJAT-29790 TaxID=1895002 RepID=UPI001C24FE98|nr:DNA sulfur modification protein DndB [Bacillus sp. FJAT-29790]MBU8877949.1 DGQHR domain-containing protein [Bacillus sp. FJAT-29790]
MLATDSITTISGTKGKQFGKDVYTSLIKFKDLEEFLAVFPHVQRNVDKKRVNLISGYILKGLEDENMSFLTSLTVTCRGNMFFNDSKQMIAIDTTSRLSINDGQHRFEGVKKAISELRKEIKKTKAGEVKNALKRKLDYLNDMVLPIVIFANISENEEKQLFHDLNNLAKPPSKSVSLKFDQSNLYIRLAKEISLGNDYLVSYGIDMESDRLSDKNTNFALLSTIANSICFLLVGTEKQTEDFLTQENFQTYKSQVNETFDNLFSTLPDDITNRKKYLLGKATTLQGICKFIHNTKSKFMLSDEVIYGIIETTEWRHNDIWLSHGGSWDKDNKNITFPGSGTGIRAVYQMLMANLNKFQSEEKG